MENFGKFMTILLAMVISPIIHGLVMLRLWAWFMVPIFEMEPLRLVEAIGIVFIIAYLKAKRQKVVMGTFWDDFWTTLSFTMFNSVFTLLLGWIIHLFM